MEEKSKSAKQESVEPVAAGDEFAARWLKRLGLPSAWREPVRAHLEDLCFHDPQETWPLMESLFDIVPGILNRGADSPARTISNHSVASSVKATGLLPLRH